MNGFGPPLAGTPGFYIGDGTGWSSSAAAIAWFTITSATCCIADLNGNGQVGFEDLLDLLADWGPCLNACELCVADIDGNCTVGFADLLELLADWGPWPGAV